MAATGWPAAVATTGWPAAVTKEQLNALGIVEAHIVIQLAVSLGANHLAMHDNRVFSMGRNCLSANILRVGKCPSANILRIVRRDQWFRVVGVNYLAQPIALAHLDVKRAELVDF